MWVGHPTPCCVSPGFVPWHAGGTVKPYSGEICRLDRPWTVKLGAVPSPRLALASPPRPPLRFASASAFDTLNMSQRFQIIAAVEGCGSCRSWAGLNDLKGLVKITKFSMLLPSSKNPSVALGGTSLRKGRSPDAWRSSSGGSASGPWRRFHR